MEELIGKVAVALATEIFKDALSAVKNVRGTLLAKDFAGIAAQQYTEFAERRHNAMRIFGMSRPIPLDRIYTKVNMLAKIQRNDYTTLADLTQEISISQRRFGRFLAQGRDWTRLMNWIVLSFWENLVRAKLPF